MANYYFNSSASARDDILNMARSLLRRSMLVHQAFCPVGREEVFLAITTEADRAAFAHVNKRGYYLPNNHYISAWVRGAGVNNGTKVKFRSSGMPCVNNDDNQNISFDLDTLEPHKRAAFVKWLNALNRETRLSVAAIAVATEFVQLRCGASTASMYRRWPEFILVLTNMHKPWPERARTLPKVRLATYEWGDHYNWYLENMKRIEIIGGMLAGATLLTVPDNDKSEVKAEIVDWTRTPKVVAS